MTKSVLEARLLAFGRVSTYARAGIVVMLVGYLIFPVYYEIQDNPLFHRLAMASAFLAVGLAATVGKKLFYQMAVLAGVVFGVSMIPYVIYGYFDLTITRMPLAILAGYCIYAHAGGSKLGVLPLVVATGYFVQHWWLEGNLLTAIEGSSYNHISAIMIAVTGFAYLTAYRENVLAQVPPIWPALLCLVISVMAIGRGGIVSASLLAVCVVTVRFRDKIGLMLLIIIPILLLTFGQQWLSDFRILSTYDLVLSKFEDGSVSSNIRFRIWSNYIDAQDVVSFLFGYPADRIVRNMGATMHNSYLLWHQRTGVFAFVLLFLVFRALWLGRKNVVLLGLLTAMLLRGMTDTVVGESGFLLDPVFVACILLIYRTYAPRRASRVALSEMLTKNVAYSPA